MSNGPSSRSWRLGLLFARSMRTQNIRGSLVIFIVTAWLGHREIWFIIYGTFFIILVYGATVIVNDLADLSVDQLNHRSMPYAVGQLSKESMYLFLFSLLATIIGLIFIAKSGVFAIFLAIYVFIAWAYSLPPLSLSRRGFVKPVILALSYSILPFYLAIYSYQIKTILACIVAGVLLMTHVSFLLYQDIKDTYGDRISEKITPVVKYGERTVRIISLGLMCVALIVITFLSQGNSLSIVLVLVAGILHIMQFIRKYRSPYPLSGSVLAAFIALLPSIHQLVG